MSDNFTSVLNIISDALFQFQVQGSTAFQQVPTWKSNRITEAKAGLLLLTRRMSAHNGHPRRNTFAGFKGSHDFELSQDNKSTASIDLTLQGFILVIETLQTTVYIRRPGPYSALHAAVETFARQQALRQSTYQSPYLTTKHEFPDAPPVGR